ncbi:MAG: hypothetical protein R3F59_32010 [Myxococcota bacterium]
MCLLIPAAEVTRTNIFARDRGDGWQDLAYAMRLDAPTDVAMVLPLPTDPRAGAAAVRFHDLSDSPDLFDRLEDCFEVTQLLSVDSLSLPVVEVGSFDATFVPTADDFRAVDPRFRLPPAVWRAWPAMRGMSFAVFALRPGEHDVHPMGLSFRRADPTTLYFPTLHLHDGVVHEEAHFDHRLYAQSRTDRPALQRWRRSDGPLGAVGPLVDPDAPGWRLELYGTLPNTDVVI